MQTPTILANEAARLDALRKLDILDTEAEQDFDDITALASTICNVPISLVSLVDHDRQWFKSRVGLDAAQTPRDVSFCGHAIADDLIFEVPDARIDQRFFDNPLVVNDPSVRFYAGAPLIDKNGFRLGTLCVLDQTPKQLTDAQKKSLATLAKQVVRQMELRAVKLELAAAAQQLVQTSAFQSAVLNSPALAMISVALDGSIVSFSEAAGHLLRTRACDAVGKRTLQSFYLGRFDPAHITQAGSSDGVSTADADSATVTALADLTTPAVDGLTGCGEWWLKRGDGSAVLTRSDVSIVTDQQANIVGYLATLHDITELKKAQSLVANSQDFLRKVAARVPGVIYQFLRRADGSSCFPYASDGLKTLFDVEPAAVMHDASSIYARIHPDDLVATVAAIDHSAQTLTPWRLENRIQLPDGRVRWVFGNSVPERQADGSVLWHGFLTDITERKDAELALQTNQRFLQTLVDNLPVGVYTKRMQTQDQPGGGRFLIWNHAAERMSGVLASDVLGLLNRDVFAPEKADMHAQHDAALISTRQAITVPVYPVTRPDGSTRLLRMTSIPLFDVDGQIEYTIGISEDLTDLLRQQDELKYRTAELEAVNDGLPLGLFQTDVQGLCRYVNRTFETITGLNAEACFGMRWTTAVHPDDLADAERNWSHSVEHQTHYHGTLRYLRANGKIALVSVRCAPIKIAEKIVGYVGTVDDITVRRAASDAIAANEKRLQLLTNNVPCIIGYINADERLKFCNVQYKKLMGLDPAALQDKTLREAFGENIYAIIAPYVKKVLTGCSQSFERTIEVDGAVLHQQCEYIADVDEHGRVLGFYALITDVTERQIAAQRVARTERRLRAITDNIPALVAHIDTDERYLFVNKKLAVDARKSTDEILGATLQQIQSPALYAASKPYIERVLAGASSHFESRIDGDGDDEARHFQVTYIPEKDDNQHVIGFYSTTIDITEIKTNELRQIASEKRLKTITDNVPVGISYIDASLRFRFINATMASWTANTAEEILGKSVRRVIGIPAFDERQGYYKRVLAGERVEFVQTTMTPGGERVLQATYLPDRADDGTIKGFYTLSSDITELKKTEQVLIQLARFDSLTGLQNRASLFDTMRAGLARSRRNGTPFALMYLDIDRFKSINDSRGHGIGDLVLQEFARRLSTAIRETDTVARLGGDEFVIVLEALNSENNARDVAQKILDKVRVPWLLQGETLSISTSIGILYDAHHRMAPDDLLRLADEQLYVAKSRGRDQFSFAITH